MIESFIQSYIETGIFVSIFFVINELFHLKEKKRVGFHLFIALLGGMSQSKLSILLKHSHFPSPWLFFTSITVIFLFGPAQYSQTLRIFDKFSFKEISKHFSIILFTIPAEILIIFKYPEFMLETGVIKWSVILICLLAIIHYLFYFYINQKIFSEQLEVLNIQHSKDVFRYNLMTAIIICFSFIAVASSNVILIKLTGVIISTGSFMAVFYLFRHPDFFDTISNEVNKRKYERTSIGDLNIESIKVQLETLMIDKKYYQDDQIYIEDIANELLINKNQLSRVLNEMYSKNFYQFINFYRIQEAKELLLQNPNKTVLDIAYEVGFKSKSAFYKNFVELTTVTPQEYRKRN